VLAVYLLFSVACFLTVHEHSPQAYLFLQFSQRLPHQRSSCFLFFAHVV